MNIPSYPDSCFSKGRHKACFQSTPTILEKYCHLLLCPSLWTHTLDFNCGFKVHNFPGLKTRSPFPT